MTPMGLPGALDAKCEQCRDRPPTMRIVLAHWGDQPGLAGVLAVPMEAR